MLKFIGKALAGLVLTKEAQEAASQLAKAKAAALLKKPMDERAQAVADAAEAGKAIVTPDRAELIRQAMSVRAAKQTILADLNDEDRAKLVAVALKAFLNESRSKE